jgi:hypothetical protein
VKAEAALERAGRALLVGMAGQQRGIEIDVQLLGRPDQLPRARARPGMSVAQPLKPAGVAGNPVDDPNVVELDATCPNSAC